MKNGYLHFQKTRMVWVVIIGVFVLLASAGMVLYNRLISAKNLTETAFSDIDVQLNKRFQLVPQLIQITKNYAAYESNLLEQLVAQRSGKSLASESQVAENDTAVTETIQKIALTVEQYPDLKADKQFLQLMGQLTEIENHLMYARRFYNGATREYNNRIESFPSNLIAGSVGLTTKSLYEVPNEMQREIPVTPNLKS